MYVCMYVYELHVDPAQAAYIVPNKRLLVRTSILCSHAYCLLVYSVINIHTYLHACIHTYGYAYRPGRLLWCLTVSLKAFQSPRCVLSTNQLLKLRSKAG